jgi:hypothetical protein
MPSPEYQMPVPEVSESRGSSERCRAANPELSKLLSTILPSETSTQNDDTTINKFCNKITNGKVPKDLLSPLIDSFMTFLTTSHLPLPFNMLRKLWISDPSSISKAFSEGKIDNSFLVADQKAFEEGLTLAIIEWRGHKIPDKQKFLRRYFAPPTRGEKARNFKLPIEAVVLASNADSATLQEVLQLLIRLKVKMTLADVNSIFAQYEMSTSTLEPFFPLLDWTEEGLFACLYAQSNKNEKERDDFLEKYLIARKFGSFSLPVPEFFKPVWAALHDDNERELKRLFKFLRNFPNPLPELLDQHSSMSRLAASSQLGSELITKYRAFYESI